jgi:hypothetical protein
LYIDLNFKILVTLLYAPEKNNIPIICILYMIMPQLNTTSTLALVRMKSAPAGSKPDSRWIYVHTNITEPEFPMAQRYIGYNTCVYMCIHVSISKVGARCLWKLHHRGWRALLTTSPACWRQVIPIRSHNLILEGWYNF